MAVKKSTPSQVNKTSAFKRMVLTLVALSIMGWLILLGWAIFIWVAHDFESAYQWIQPTLQILNDVQHHANLLWVLIHAASLVMLMKFVVLITAIPLFFLSVMAGLIDGLNQRAIRAACLGRESTYVFHKSVPIAHKSICWILAIWLCVPVTLPPAPIFVGLALILGFVMRVSASRFKKYL